MPISIRRITTRAPVSTPSERRSNASSRAPGRASPRDGNAIRHFLRGSTPYNYGGPNNQQVRGPVLSRTQPNGPSSSHYGLLTINRLIASLRLLDTALKVVEHPHVRADPRRQILATRCFGIDQAARAEDADEELDHDLLAGLRIDQVRALAGEIDKQLLARAMHLAHRR